LRVKRGVPLSNSKSQVEAARVTRSRRSVLRENADLTRTFGWRALKRPGTPPAALRRNLPAATASLDFQLDAAHCAGGFVVEIEQRRA